MQIKSDKAQHLSTSIDADPSPPPVRSSESPTLIREYRKCPGLPINKGPVLLNGQYHKSFVRTGMEKITEQGSIFLFVEAFHRERSSTQENARAIYIQTHGFMIVLGWNLVHPLIVSSMTLSGRDGMFLRLRRHKYFIKLSNNSY